MLVRGYQWWIWPALLIPVSFVVIGIGGLVYTALHWGKSAERRAAAVRSVPAPELFDLPAAVDPEYPVHPGRQRDHQQSRHASGLSPAADALAGLDAVRSSGGLRRLERRGIGLRGDGRTQFLCRNSRLADDAVHRAVPCRGRRLVVVFARLLRHAAGIGPTLVEISDHPLLPGNRYRLFLSQSGNLRLKSIEVSLICEEEAVFRQGTNARTESREVFRQSLHAGGSAIIRPGEPLEAECDLPIPSEAMHSFRASHNQVQWKLIVHGEIVGWPGFQRSFPVVVRPLIVAHVNGRTGS